MNENEEKLLRESSPIFPKLPTELKDLLYLAFDLRRSSSAAAQELWGQVDNHLWEKTHNPWLILRLVSSDRLQELAKNKEFCQLLKKYKAEKLDLLQSKGWFQETHSKTDLKAIAYFSMEFGLSEALPIYSGGLGILAGDYLKTASDLGVPLVGIGLLYQKGYFRQFINIKGEQQEVYPYNEPLQLPINRMKNEKGELLFIPLSFPGRIIWLRVWEAFIGRVKLYLLDTNDLINSPVDRGITSELYGGGSEIRLQQEIILGIGGWKLLKKLGIDPQICHLNEGHAAFAILERAHSFMEEHKMSFAKALMVTRAGNLFTTHTPVSAGFDRYSPDLIAVYFDHYVKQLGISLQDLLSLGRENHLDSNEPLNMAYLAFRGSGAVNGVSQLHGQVSKKLFAPLFPRWPIEEVPVGYVTNGIHIPSWESPDADILWTSSCGKKRWLGTMEAIKKDFSCVKNEEIWDFRNKSREKLIHFIRATLAQQKKISGGSAEEIAAAQTIFDPNVLTLGFARRFASYKRVDLLLHDRNRLIKLISNADKPVQLVIAGKAHPQDYEGKKLISEWINFIKEKAICQSIVFLQDYDMMIAQQLVRGVDVWINTPRYPWEASGTSGMKLLANGGLNLSELDGWWSEAYSPDVGWAIGDRQVHSDNNEWDQCEAEALYSILEKEVIPLFYQRQAKGIPVEWIERIRNSMTKLTPHFSTNRMLREYVETYYLPGCSSYLKRSANDAKKGIQLENWCHLFEEKWKNTHFITTHIENITHGYLFQAQVHLGDLKPDEVRIELYASSQNGTGPFLQVMNCASILGNGDYLYKVEIPVNGRSTNDFTPRIVPNNSDIKVPIEAAEILWQR